ncbi:MAG TPA: MJ0042-type zinc finger domain-containing protein [Acidobacteriota bacterium]
MIRVRCPHCQTVLGLSQLPAGGRVRCGHCGKVLALRRPAETPAAGPAPSAPPGSSDRAAPRPQPAPGSIPPAAPASTQAPEPTRPDWVADMNDSDWVQRAGSSYPSAAAPTPAAAAPPREPESASSPVSTPAPALQEAASPPPAAAAEGKLWQVQPVGEPIATVPFDRVKAMLQAGEIGPETLVLAPGRGWSVAGEIPLLSRYLDSLALSGSALAAAARPASELRCANHPGAAALWRCRSCGKELCASCTEEAKFGGRTVHLCLRCEDQCDSLVEAPEAAGAAASGVGRMHLGRHGEVYEPAGPFWHRIHTLPFYPLAGKGWLRLVGLWLLTVCASISIYAILLYALFYAYMLHIINRSAEHEDRMPPFPELTDFFDDYVLPFLRYLCVSFYGVIVVVVYNLVLRQRGFLEMLDSFVGLMGEVDPINWVVVGLLVFYYPMVLMAIGVVEDLRVALNPILIARYIVAIFPEYLLHYIAQLLLLGAWMLAGMVFATGLTMLRIGPDLRAIVQFAGVPLIAVYFQVLQYRLVGMLAAQSRHKLNWI